MRVAVAGSTGSIGRQTLDVVRAEAGAYEIVGLGVGSSVDALIEQATELRPKVVAVADFVCPSVDEEGVAQVIESYLDSLA